MGTRLRSLLAAAAAASALAGSAAAQDLVIGGTRIIVGNGRVIERGSIVVRDGRIVWADAGAPPASAVPPRAVRIDGAGRTVMAGYIDGHRHLMQGDPEQFLRERAAVRMRELLEAGFTTVQSGGDANAGILELKRQIESGRMKGPHIVTSARVPTATLGDEAQVRRAVDEAVEAGAESIAEVWFPAKGPPPVLPATEAESRNLAAGVDEARRRKVEFQVHAISPYAMLAAVRLGVRKLVHTPSFGWLTDAEAREVHDAGAQVCSSAGYAAPVFGVFNQENKPTFRNGMPWPEGIPDGEGRGREAGNKPVNGRTLFDNGVHYAFCTDTTYDPSAGLAVELKMLNLVFSPLDIIQIMGPNSAEFVARDDIGLLEPGRRGDLVVLRGDPREGYWNLLKPLVVVKDGVVVVDRTAVAAGTPSRG